MELCYLCWVPQAVWVAVIQPGWLLWRLQECKTLIGRGAGQYQGHGPCRCYSCYQYCCLCFYFLCLLCLYCCCLSCHCLHCCCLHCHCLCWHCLCLASCCLHCRCLLFSHRATRAAENVFWMLPYTFCWSIFLCSELWTVRQNCLHLHPMWFVSQHLVC